MHLNEGDLLAFLDGAVEEDQRSDFEEHLAGCAECTARLEEQRELSALFADAVSLLDSEAPVVVPEPPRRGWGPAHLMGAGTALLRAAVIVLLVGGVAWGAMPGSALRGWVGQLWEAGAALLGDRVEEDRSPETEEPVRVVSQAGLSILPVAGEAMVVLGESMQGLAIRVRMVAIDQVVVVWSGSGDEPRFRTAPGRIEVLGAGEGEVVVEAPRGARVVVKVGGREVAIAEGGEIRRLAPAEVEGDDVVIRLSDLER